MVLLRNTSPFHDNYLCQIIFKSHHVRLSYGLDTILEYTNTHIHTDRVNSICPSTILWRGHKKFFFWRGGGVQLGERGARVSKFFFTKNPNKKENFFFGGGGGGGGGEGGV